MLKLKSALKNSDERGEYFLASFIRRIKLANEISQNQQVDLPRSFHPQTPDRFPGSAA